MVWLPIERSSGGRGRLTSAMSEFYASLDSCNPIDPSLKGAQFIWSSHGKVPILSRID